MHFSLYHAKAITIMKRFAQKQTLLMFKFSCLYKYKSNKTENMKRVKKARDDFTIWTLCNRCLLMHAWNHHAIVSDTYWCV